MNTVVAIKGTLDVTFPQSTWFPTKGERVPGGELAELIQKGLSQHGFDAEEVSYEEPFFVTRPLCHSGNYRYEILSYIYYPDETDAVWAVECAPRLGFWARLLGKSEDSELGAVLKAIDETLRNDSRVREKRWFKDLPGSPFAAQRYGRSPTEAA